MKSIIILSFLLFINHFVLAQKSTEILPNSITLPRLSTTEQNTVPPQQAGNIIYNADEKKLALHDGTNWNYLTANAAANGFQNLMTFFSGTSTWTVPAGVNKIRVELWGGGQGGSKLQSVGAIFTCQGGRGAAYALFELNVTPNEVLDISVANGSGILYGSDNVSQIKRNNTVIALASLFAEDTMPYTGLINVVDGELGQVAEFSFQQVESGVFRKIVRTGAGGGTYPYFNNGGRSSTLEFTVPAGTLVGYSDHYFFSNGSVGGGSACTYLDTIKGARGRIKIYY